ncbi:MAG: DUF1175 domain-containing protein [Acidobacteriia bacterium]|nr:DUF1175 domain-containing protein [Terriglobia bacterium]
MRRKLFVSIYLVLLGILGISFLLPSKIVIEPDRIDLPADGISRTPVRLQVQMPVVRRIFFPHPKITTQVIQGADFVNLFPTDEVRLRDHGVSYFVKSRAAEGEAVIRFKVHNTPAGELRVFTHTVNSDSNQDGFPDSFQLTSFTDRENFRHAFAFIADLQVSRTSPEWPVGEHHAAGLVCFAVREALRGHSETWQRRFGASMAVPSVEKYSFPMTPLGEKIFRTQGGAYLPTDLANGFFSDCVNVATMREFNVTFTGRDRSRAQKGDLLFFSIPGALNFPDLVMIFLKDSSIQSSGYQDNVVYYRESAQAGEGTVIESRLGLLERDPDPRLRPIESNKFFLGFFRLKVLY